MSEIDGLLKAYERYVKVPWEKSLSGPEKVWFAVYDPAAERKLRFRLKEFEIASTAAGHNWQLCDLTNTFAEWMGAHDYRDAYFQDPADLTMALTEFTEHAALKILDALSVSGQDENSIVAVIGIASLFGLTRASSVIEQVTPNIKGRLLVFFPGRYEGSNYRLLDARDGWNYRAVPISADSWK